MDTRCMSWAVVAVLFVLVAEATAQGPFANTTDSIPGSYTGLRFELSKDYPSQLPTNQPEPWKQIDFKTDPAGYIQAVFDYCLEGQEAADFVVQNNSVRKWHHAPGLIGGTSGREFVRGLTRERTSRPGELHVNQSSFVQNWGTGFFNPVGGFTVGQVWADPAKPDPNKAEFGEGTVSFKLLFTRALVGQVPYLSRTLRWRANVNRNGSPIRVKLLQMDIAVKDNRAETGWVFGTLVYQNNSDSGSPWTRMVPACLSWGNDPELTQAKFDAGDRPQESWIAPDLLEGPKKLPHFGWLNRANGPVDNPRSACMSCHMTAQWPLGPMLPQDSDSSAVKMSFFQNLKYPTPFTSGRTSLDFSLQLAMGIRNFPGTAPAAAFAVQPEFNLREGSAGDAFEVADVDAGPEDPADDIDAEANAESPDLAKDEQPGGIPWILIGAVILVLVIVLLIGASRKK